MIMSYLRCFVRVILFATALFFFFIFATLSILICLGDSKKARPFLIDLVSLISKIGLLLFGINLKTNLKTINLKKNYLFVSNHMSYLDILSMSSVLRTCFVTSLEMKKTPFLGQLCTLGGCLFVDRKNKRGLSKEVISLTDVLLSGLNITIYPEAKSTNGDKVHLFKRPLFQAAIDANVEIVPVCLNYIKLDGKKVTKKNRDHLFWYDEMSFFPHALKLFSKKNSEIELTFFPPIKASDYADKNALAEKCYDVIFKNYVPIQDFQ